MARRRLYGFDSEGTLMTPYSNDHPYPSVWPLIADELGAQAVEQEAALTKLWDQQKKTGKVLVGDYVDYMNKTIMIHREQKLTKEQFEHVLSAKIKYLDGIEEVFSMIRKRGDIIAIVSGGFSNQIDQMPGRKLVNEVRAACTYHFYEKSGLLKSWDLKEYDWHGKVDAFKEICRMYDINMRLDSYFVTDGKNDVPIVREVAHPIALNAQSELEAAVKELGGLIFRTSTLKRLVPYLDL